MLEWKNSIKEKHFNFSPNWGVKGVNSVRQADKCPLQFWKYWWVFLYLGQIIKKNIEALICLETEAPGRYPNREAYEVRVENRQWSPRNGKIDIGL